MSSAFCEENVKNARSGRCGHDVADSDFALFFGRAFRDRQRGGPPLRKQAREDGHQTAAEDARDAGEHIARDGLMQDQERQQRRECGLEEEHERRCLCARDLHRQEVARKADAGHADVDIEDDRQICRRVAREKGDARKGVCLLYTSPSPRDS